MKKKIINFAVDILLIMVVFSLTDWFMLSVLQSKKILPELLVYLVFYAIAFGLKTLIIKLWNNLSAKKNNKG